MGIFDKIKELWTEYRTPTRIAPPTTQAPGTIGGTQVVQTPPSMRQPTQVHSTTPTVRIHGKEPEEKKVVKVIRDPRTFAETKQALASMEGSVASKIPKFEQIVDKSVSLAERSPKATSALIGMREAMIATPQRQLTTDIVSSFGESVYTEVQKKPLQTAAWVGVGYGSGAVISGVGKGASIVSRAAAPIVSRIPLASKVGRGVGAASKTVLETKYAGTLIKKSPEIAMGGLFGYTEYKHATAPVYSGAYDYKTQGDEIIGTPIMREPTYPEMAGRLGGGAVIGAAVLSGAGLARAEPLIATKLKDVFKVKPKTAETIATESERLYTTVKGFKVTETTQPYKMVDGIMGGTSRRVKIITEDVPEGLISSAERRRYKDVVQFQEERDLLSTTKFTTTAPSGEIKTVEQIGKTTLVKRSPEMVDIVAGVEQKTLSGMSVGRVGSGSKSIAQDVTARTIREGAETGIVKIMRGDMKITPSGISVKYGDVGKDVFKRGSKDWDVIITQPDKFTLWSKVGGVAKSPFVTTTELKYARGSVLGPAGDIRTTDSIFSTVKMRTPAQQPIKYSTTGKPITPKYKVMEDQPLATRDFDVKVEQSEIRDFFSEGVRQIPLTKFERVFGHGRKDTIMGVRGRSLEAIESAKSVITPKPRIIDKSMKGFNIKPDKSMVGSVGKEIKPSTAKGMDKSQTVGLIEDTATKPKTKGIVAEQIVGVKEPKIVQGTQGAILSPKVKIKPIQRTGGVMIAPSIRGLVGSVQPEQLQEPSMEFAPMLSIRDKSAITPVSIIGIKAGQQPRVTQIPTQTQRQVITTRLDTQQLISQITLVEPIGDKVRPIKEIFTPPPKPITRIPIVPLVVLPKKDKKKDKKAKQISKKSFQWFIYNPIASPFGNSVGKVNK